MLNWLWKIKIDQRLGKSPKKVVKQNKKKLVFSFNGCN